jgi:hypothetical protein
MRAAVLQELKSAINQMALQWEDDLCAAQQGFEALGAAGEAADMRRRREGVQEGIDLIAEWLRAE